MIPARFGRSAQSNCYATNYVCKASFETALQEPRPSKHLYARIRDTKLDFPPTRPSCCLNWAIGVPRSISSWHKVFVLPFVQSLPIWSDCSIYIYHPLLCWLIELVLYRETLCMLVSGNESRDQCVTIQAIIWCFIGTAFLIRVSFTYFHHSTPESILSSGAAIIMAIHQGLRGRHH